MAAVTVALALGLSPAEIVSGISAMNRLAIALDPSASVQSL